MKLLSTTLALLMLFTMAHAGEKNPFFAMDTIARGKPEVVVPMLRELGYAGLGGAPGDAAMARALTAAGLRYFNGYHTITLDASRPALDEPMRKMIEAMPGSALWLAVAGVQRDGMVFPISSADADETAVARLRELSAHAAPRGVKIALYPHTGHWLERVEDAIRLAGKVDDPAVGVTFNLCHWLKVEGSQRDPAPVLRAALPRLMFVTINGADTGDTKTMGWERLIRPLGEGSYDVGAFLRSLRATGYDGPVGFQGYGIPGDARAVLEKTMAAWRELQP